MLPGKSAVRPARSADRPAIRAQIDENLRRVYDEVLTEAVPDRFLDLLAKLNSAAPVSADADK